MVSSLDKRARAGCCSPLTLSLFPLRMAQVARDLRWAVPAGLLVASCLQLAESFSGVTPLPALRGGRRTSTLSGASSLALTGWHPALHADAGDVEGQFTHLRTSISSSGSSQRRRCSLAAASMAEAEGQAPASHSPRRSALRRLRLLVGAGTLSVLTAGAGSAVAFENAIPEAAKFAKKPKRRGDAGVKTTAHHCV